MSQPESLDRDARFIQYLCGLASREDRAALAALRRGLSAHDFIAPEMYRYVVPWLGEAPTYADERRLYLVAALFASNPASADVPDNLGASMRRLREDGGNESIEKRFTALLSSDLAFLGVHLRHAVSLLASKELPVGWLRLLKDLRFWNSPDRRIQREWARDFWRGEVALPDETAANSLASA